MNNQNKNTIKKDKLIQGLNQDLAAELGTVIRYTYQAAKCYGLLAAELRELLAKALAKAGYTVCVVDADSTNEARCRIPTRSTSCGSA